MHHHRYPNCEFYAAGNGVWRVKEPGVEQFVSEHDTGIEASDEADRLNELHDVRSYGSVREARFHISGLRLPPCPSRPSGGSLPAGSLLAGGTRR